MSPIKEALEAAAVAGASSASGISGPFDVEAAVLAFLKSLRESDLAVMRGKFDHSTFYRASVRKEILDETITEIESGKG